MKRTDSYQNNSKRIKHTLSPLEYINSHGIITIISFCILTLFIGLSIGNNEYAAYLLILLTALFIFIEVTHSINLRTNNSSHKPLHLINWVFFFVYSFSTLLILSIFFSLFFLFAERFEGLGIQEKLTPALLLFTGIIIFTISLTIGYYIIFASISRVNNRNASTSHSSSISPSHIAWPLSLIFTRTNNHIRDAFVFGGLGGIFVGIITILTLMMRV